jgi:hypothetical protein
MSPPCPATQEQGDRMTPAERTARTLVREHGRSRAREIVQAKLDDMAFMVRPANDRPFWLAVMENLP